MEVKFMKETTTVILSLRMAGYLAFQGNALLNTKDDIKGTGRKIFIFSNTEKLKRDMSNYKKFLAKVS